MNGAILLSLGLFFFVVALVVIIRNKRPNHLTRRAANSIRPHCVINTHEQPVYLRLKKALPDCYILVHVSHAVLLTTANQSIRIKINMNHADFVVLDHKFKVLGIIDMNDASHKEHLKTDHTSRNKYLIQAGYKVITYTSTPDIETIKADFIATPPAYADMYAEYYDDL